MNVIRKLVTGGLALMAVVALATAIWPSLATVIEAVFGVVLAAAVAVPGAFAVRWVRGELAWRRELPTMPPVGLAAQDAVALAPTLAELRESA